MILNGAEILLECFKEHQVNTIFGYPGGAVIPFYDALYDQKDNFTHIRTSHEQSAIHAADGYARVTGKVGVGVVTSGPGATNAITGIATAYLDSIPLIVISGQVPTSLLGKDSFQEIDITGVTMSITKHNYLVRDIKDLANIVRKAFNVATSGRKGPVLIDIPKDIFLSKTEYHRLTIEPCQKFAGPLQDYDINLLKRAAEIINNAERPVICAGGGAKSKDASESLVMFAEKGNIPVVNTLMGLGSIPREHNLSLGLVGMHGLEEANLAITNSDVIIAIGSRFSDRLMGKEGTFAPKAKVIHIDIDNTEINKNCESYLPIVGAVEVFLLKLLELIDVKKLDKWHKQITAWKAENRDKCSFTPRNILNEVNEVFNENVVVATDVGQHQMWTAQYWNFSQSQQFVTSGGLGTMGFGLGAAIGSQLGKPHSKVVLVTGDGSFNMTCNELATLSRYDIPVVIILLNNSTLGMVRQWQKMFSQQRYSETDLSEVVNYQKLANAYGIKGYKVEDIAQLHQILNDTSKISEPVLIECVIDKDENVYPIVPPGQPINKMITKWGAV